jgi:hypothetical protein
MSHSFKIYLAAGSAAVLAGTLTFLIIHALIIRPIWAMLPPGIIFAGLVGAAVGWSYSTLRDHMAPHPWPMLIILAIYTAAIVPSLVLPRLWQPLLDRSTSSITPEQIAAAASMVIVDLLLPGLIVGGVAGWIIGHNKRAVLSTALAVMLINIGPGHNMPFMAGTPAEGKAILLMFSGLFVGSIVLVETDHWLKRF